MHIIYEKHITHEKRIKNISTMKKHIMKEKQMSDRYAKALERALYNWYYCGDGAKADPVMNMLSEGSRKGMQLLVPIEIPQELLQQLAEAEELREGTEFSINEELPISFRHIPVDEAGHYLVPLYTSEEQMKPGGETSAIAQPFAELLDMMDQWPDCVGYVINPYSEKILVDAGIREAVRNYNAKSHVAFVRGSVMDMKVAAVVNSANKTLLGGKAVDEILLSEGEIDEAFLCGGGLNGALHEAAGAALFDECRTLGGCMPGDAKITGAHGFKNADHIIHAVGPFYRGEEEEEYDRQLLASCYSKALDLAAENGCDSVAFPCISTGVQRFPVYKAAPVALVAVIEWFEAHPETVMNVYLCSFTDNEYKSYLNLIKS